MPEELKRYFLGYVKLPCDECGKRTTFAISAIGSQFDANAPLSELDLIATCLTTLSISRRATKLQKSQDLRVDHLQVFRKGLEVCGWEQMNKLRLVCAAAPLYRDFQIAHQLRLQVQRLALRAQKANRRHVAS